MTKSTKAQKTTKDSLIGLLNSLAEFLRSEADSVAQTAQFSTMSALSRMLCLNNSIRRIRAQLDVFENDTKKLPLV